MRNDICNLFRFFYLIFCNPTYPEYAILTQFLPTYTTNFNLYPAEIDDTFFNLVRTFQTLTGHLLALVDEHPNLERADMMIEKSNEAIDQCKTISNAIIRQMQAKKTKDKNKKRVQKANQKKALK